MNDFKNPCRSTWICVEIPHKPDLGAVLEGRRIHTILIPNVEQPKGYTTSLCLEAFRFGKRKGASQGDKTACRGACNWGPKAVYLLKSERDWLQETEQNLASIRKTLPHYPDERELQKTEHASLEDFFKHIRFNTKLRGYLDDCGKEAKYSTIPLAKTGPEIEI